MTLLGDDRVPHPGEVPPPPWLNLSNHPAQFVMIHDAFLSCYSVSLR
jgi:hypothetical protein